MHGFREPKFPRACRMTTMHDTAILLELRLIGVLPATFGGIFFTRHPQPAFSNQQHDKPLPKDTEESL